MSQDLTLEQRPPMFMDTVVLLPDGRLIGWMASYLDPRWTLGRAIGSVMQTCRRPMAANEIVSAWSFGPKPGRPNWSLLTVRLRTMTKAEMKAAGLYEEKPTSTTAIQRSTNSAAVEWPTQVRVSLRSGGLDLSIGVYPSLPAYECEGSISVLVDEILDRAARDNRCSYYFEMHRHLIGSTLYLTVQR